MASRQKKQAPFVTSDPWIPPVKFILIILLKNFNWSIITRSKIIKAEAANIFELFLSIAYFNYKQYKLST